MSSNTADFVERGFRKFFLFPQFRSRS